MRVLTVSCSVLGMMASLFALSCSSTTNSTPEGGVASSGSSGGDDGGNAGCATTGLDMPVVSFSTDIVPVFVMSCAFSGCHNQMGGSLQFLADRTAPSAMWMAQSYAAIVSQPSVEDPSMDFVKPSDPANSYLMRKMDNNLADIKTQCTATNTVQAAFPDAFMTSPCGGFMPDERTLTLLDCTPRDKVRRWIAQGAKNN